MDAGLIIILIFISAIGVGTYLYICGECCESPQEQERGDISPRSSESTVRVTSPIH